VSELRRDLDLDAGYLSRILSGFTESGFGGTGRSRRSTAVARSFGDGGRPTGVRRAGPVADKRPSMPCWSRWMTINECGSSAPMVQIRRILGSDAGRSGLVFRPPEPGDLGGVVEPRRPHAAEYGWDATFEALVARIVADFAERRDTDGGGVDLELDGERVGCVFCTAADAEDTAQLRLLLVEPSARGAGVGTAWLVTSAYASPGDPAIGESPVDQRCSARSAPDLRARGLSLRPSRAAPQFRVRPCRRVNWSRDL